QVVDLMQALPVHRPVGRVRIPGSEQDVGQLVVVQAEQSGPALGGVDVSPAIAAANGDSGAVSPGRSGLRGVALYDLDLDVVAVGQDSVGACQDRDGAAQVAQPGGGTVPARGGGLVCHTPIKADLGPFVKSGLSPGRADGPPLRPSATRGAGPRASGWGSMRARPPISDSRASPPAAPRASAPGGSPPAAPGSAASPLPTGAPGSPTCPGYGSAGAAEESRPLPGRGRSPGRRADW